MRKAALTLACSYDIEKLCQRNSVLLWTRTAILSANEACGYDPTF
jgi:hypothetical protein